MSTISKKVEILKKTYVRYGVWGFLQLVTQRVPLLSHLFVTRTTEIFELAEFNEKYIRRPMKNYSILRASPSDIDCLLSCLGDEGKGYEGKLFLKYFEEGHSCFAIKKYENDKIVGYVWAFLNEYEFTVDDQRGCTFQLGSDASFSGTGFIKPEYRMRGLFPHLLYSVVQFCQERGLRLYTDINMMNLGSKKAHIALGFVEHGYLRCVSLFGVTRWRLQVYEHRFQLLRGSKVFVSIDNIYYYACR